MTQTVIFLTSGTTWLVPADWNSSDNKIECLGAGRTGGNGSVSATGPGGGGGAYARKNNLALTPGDTISIQVGVPSTSGTGADTWLVSTATVLAKGTLTNTGGSSVLSIGDVVFKGGNGVAGSNAGARSAGGGAAGPNGLGTNGSGQTGGSGDAGSGGAGGIGGNPPTAGSPGAEWTQTSDSATAGPGGGGGGPDTTSGINVNGGAGGSYGGGGGGGSRDTGLGGVAGGGIIVVTYTPGAASGDDGWLPCYVRRRHHRR